MPFCPPKVLGDPAQLRQVFLNLGTNAIQAMPQGGKLTIGVSERADGPGEVGRRYVAISFRDTGCGIPPENMGKVFSPFFTTKSEGIGLGLAVSHGIIENHNGIITVESEVGKGSNFTVWLPVPTLPGPQGSASLDATRPGVAESRDFSRGEVQALPSRDVEKGA